MNFDKIFLLMILSFLSPVSAEDSKEKENPVVLEGAEKIVNPAVMEDSKEADRVIAKKSDKGRVVKIDFDDELLIKGKVLGPSLFTLYQKRNVEFGRLIKPRKNFLPEMRAALGDIK